MDIDSIQSFFFAPELTEFDDNLTKEFIPTQLRVRDSGGQTCNILAQSEGGCNSRDREVGTLTVYSIVMGKEPRKPLALFLVQVDESEAQRS